MLTAIRHKTVLLLGCLLLTLMMACGVNSSDSSESESALQEERIDLSEKTNYPGSARSLPLQASTGNRIELKVVVKQKPDQYRNCAEPSVLDPYGNIIASLLPKKEETSNDEQETTYQYAFFAPTTGEYKVALDNYECSVGRNSANATVTWTIHERLPTPDIEAVATLQPTPTVEEERAEDAALEAKAQIMAKAMVEATAQAVPAITPSSIPVPTATATLEPTAIPTPLPTATFTPVPPTAIPTPLPTATPTPTPEPSWIPITVALETATVDLTIYFRFALSNPNNHIGKIVTYTTARGVGKDGYLTGANYEVSFKTIVPAKSSVTLLIRQDIRADMPDSFVIDTENSHNGSAWLYNQLGGYGGREAIKIDPINNDFLRLDNTHMYNDTNNEFFLAYLCTSTVPLNQVYEHWGVGVDDQPTFSNTQDTSNIHVAYEYFERFRPREKAPFIEELVFIGSEVGSVIVDKEDFLDKCSDWAVFQED